MLIPFKGFIIIFYVEKKQYMRELNPYDDCNLRLYPIM